MSYTLYVLEVNLVEKHSRLYTPRTYVVCNIVGSTEFYRTVTGHRDLRQVLNSSMQFDAQDSHTLLTLQLVHNRVNPCAHDPVLGLVHIRISDLTSLCEGNTVAHLHVHPPMKNGLDMHNEIANVDTITVLLSTTCAPSIKTQPSGSSSVSGSAAESVVYHCLNHLPYETFGMGAAHFPAMCKTHRGIHLTTEDRVKFLREYEHQLARGIAGINSSAILEALLGVLSGLDFIFKLGDVVSKIHWALECAWGVVSALLKLVKKNLDVEHKIVDLIIKMQKTTKLVNKVHGLSEKDHDVQDAISAVVIQVFDTATFILNYLNHGFIGRLFVQTFTDCEHRLQEHKSKLKAVEWDMNFFVTTQIAENIIGISEARRVTNVELVPMYAGTGA